MFDLSQGRFQVYVFLYKIKLDGLAKSRHPAENSDECGIFERRAGSSLSNLKNRIPVYTGMTEKGDFRLLTRLSNLKLVAIV